MPCATIILLSLMIGSVESKQRYRIDRVRLSEDDWRQEAGRLDLHAVQPDPCTISALCFLRLLHRRRPRTD